MRHDRLPAAAARALQAAIALIWAMTTAAPAAAATGPMAVTAVVVSKSNCKFSSGAMALNFGAINPASTGNVTATATHGFTCNGSAPLATFAISAGNGLWFSGGMRRMQKPAGVMPVDYIAYSLAVSPASATVPKGALQTLTVTGTIVPADFQNAAAGNYSDTVAITLTP